MLFKIINISNESIQICNIIFLDFEYQLIYACLPITYGFNLISYHVNTIKKRNIIEARK